MRLQCAHLPLQFVHFPEVISLQDGDVLTSAFSERPVVGFAETKNTNVRLMQIADARITVAESSYDFAGPVAAAVIDNDHLPVRIGLIQHRLNALRDERFVIIGGGDNGYQRFVHVFTHFSDCPR